MELSVGWGGWIGVVELRCAQSNCVVGCAMCRSDVVKEVAIGRVDQVRTCGP